MRRPPCLIREESTRQVRKIEFCRCLRNADSSIKSADEGYLVLISLLSAEPLPLLSVNVGTTA